MPTPVDAQPRPPAPRETMAAERASAEGAFDLERMCNAMGGGEYNVKLKRKFMFELERDPLFKLSDIHDLTKAEIRERTMAKFASMVHYVTNEPIAQFQQRMNVVSTADPAFWTRYGVHYGLFLGALRSGATPNQMSYWMSRGVITLQGMVGCFAMTELAHGSNVAGLETTATFDETADQFVIHTPSVSATKWWIGGAAHSATHSAVFARLIVKGMDYGTKTFVVPLRNPKTYELLPGIAIGDIGKKMGRDGIDNGWIQFTNVRIPRAYMLMKHTKVTREGEVREPPLAQLTYGALLQGRTAMVADAASTAKKALTIALRYAAVRRQFKTGDNALETQLLDYPIHQRRLLPLLAQAVAMGFTSFRMTALFEEMSEELESLGSDSDADETKSVLEKLKETHATSAGLKAFCTWNALETIEKCRASLGGHGYSAYSALPSMYNDQAVQCTWEGDNTILTLQSGRSLVSSYADAVKGAKLPGGTAYLNALPSVLTTSCPSDAATLELDTLQAAWDCVSANVVKQAHDKFEGALKSGEAKGREEALEMCSQERFIAAKVHTAGYLFRMFREALVELGKTEPADNGVVATLEQICTLYGCWAIEENAQHFLKYRFFTPSQMDAITAEVTRLCAVLRKSAVLLTDSFDLSDHIINSPLGRYDGDIYNHYFAHVKAANPHEPVAPYFARVIKPLIEREDLSFDDADEIDLDAELQELEEEEADDDEVEDEADKTAQAEKELEKPAKE
ncbi:fatty-acyl coenzyme A oxidase [Rhodotorula kratochvilovae]